MAQDYTSLLEALVIPLASGQGAGAGAAAGVDVACYCRMAACLLNCFRHMNDPRMKVRAATIRVLLPRTHCVTASRCPSVRPLFSPPSFS